jgi:hypothetical protein
MSLDKIDRERELLDRPINCFTYIVRGFRI